MAGALGGPAASPQVLVRGREFHPKLKDPLADQLEQNNVVARDLPGPPKICPKHGLPQEVFAWMSSLVSVPNTQRMVYLLTFSRKKLLSFVGQYALHSSHLGVFVFGGPHPAIIPWQRPRLSFVN